VGLPAIVLFGVIFFWTPPHFWALAMKFRDDYAAASVPMLPVVAPASVVARKILFYSYVMVATTLALAPYAGWLYTICAAGLGAWFLVEAHRLDAQVRAGEPAKAAAPAPAAVTSAPAAPAPAGGKAVAEVPVTESRWPLGHRGVPGPSGSGVSPEGGVLPRASTAEGACAGITRPSAHPAPMRLFHLSIAYLTLLFAAIAVVSLLPWGRW